MASKRFYDLNTYFRDTFGCRVQKLTVDAGLFCPNRDGTIATGGCIYCNDRGSGIGAAVKGLSIREQVTRAKPMLIRRYKAEKFLVYFQSFTNTYAPVERLRRLYEEALSVEDVVGLSIGTRPDCVDKDKLSLLEELAANRMIWIEYGLQSVHDRTLRLINRGHDFKTFENAVRQTDGRGIKMCAHVILGLPGETGDDMRETARVLSSMPIHGIKLHLLYVIKGTQLADGYQSGDYACLDMDTYANLVCDFIERLPPRLVIQRLTSDPHDYELVAPSWSLEKAAILKRINHVLETRNSWQARRFRPSSVKRINPGESQTTRRCGDYEMD